MNIAIIIPTFNRKNLLRKVLFNIKSQKECYVNLFTIVVDDGSSDGTDRMLKEHFPEVFVIRGTGNWWYTRSINEGIKYSERFKPDYILTLNDDIEINNDYLRIITNEINKVEAHSIINSVAVTKDDSVNISKDIYSNMNDNGYVKVTFAGVKKYIRWNGIQKGYIKSFTKVKPESLSGIHPTFIISGRGLLIPYAILKKLDLFDEKLPQYGSDDDFGLRAISKGYKCYISWNAKIYENIKYTSAGIAYKQEGFGIFIKSFFNKYSINSIKKSYYISIRHGYKILLPVRLIIFVLGSTRAYLFKYHK